MKKLALLICLITILLISSSSQAQYHNANQIIFKTESIGKTISSYEKTDCVQFMYKVLLQLNIPASESLKNDVYISSMTIKQVSSSLLSNNKDERVKGVVYALEKRKLGIPINVDELKKGDIIQFWTIHTNEVFKLSNKKSDDLYINENGWYLEATQEDINSKKKLYERILTKEITYGHCGIIKQIDDNKIILLSSHPSTKGYGEMEIVITDEMIVFGIRLLN